MEEVFDCCCWQVQLEDDRDVMEKLAVGGAGLKRLALLEEGEVEVDGERLVLTLERRKMLW